MSRTEAWVGAWSSLIVAHLIKMQEGPLWLVTLQGAVTATMFAAWFVQSFSDLKRKGDERQR